MPANPLVYRYCLPEGFSHLKPGVGRIVKEQRKARRMKQEALAQDIGITRSTLSRIESGAALPSPTTLERLIEVFNLEMGDFAVEGRASRRAMVIDDTQRGKQHAAMGQSLRYSRKDQKLTLAALARLSGVSASQLSRVERGQFFRSGLIGWDPDTLHLCEDDRYMIFLNPVLQKLLEGEEICDENKSTKE